MPAVRLLLSPLVFALRAVGNLAMLGLKAAVGLMVIFGFILLLGAVQRCSN